MRINLTKPLIFLDLEATGLTIGLDRIVEISMLKVNIDNSTESKTMRINPEMPIPEKVSKIHGLYEKDLVNAPTFKQAAPELLKFIANSDLAGYNSNKYDIPLLAEEFLRVEADFDLKGRRLIDIQNIFHFMEPRTLSAAYKFYCNKPLVNAHTAEADVLATYEIFKAQLDKYQDTELEDEKGNKFKPVQNDIGKICDLTTKTRNADLAGRVIFNESGIEVFAFGKHKDKAVEEVFAKEPSYYTWIMQGNFPLYTKKVVTQIRLRMKLK
ncbi:MAG: exonuclease domain-containing protein [Bacteroidia bacterium]